MFQPIIYYELCSTKKSYGSDDCSKPRQECARLIEEILHGQMVLLLEECAKVAEMRASDEIGLEDIIFVMRKNKVKLARLFRVLSIKDMRALGTSEDYGDKHNKRVKLCYDFLSKIDQTGELLTAFDEDFFDEIKHERNLRMDKMTNDMSQSEYLKYSQTRQLGFNNGKQGKFNEWLFKYERHQHLKLNSYAQEVFQYLARETIAQIVDMALLVKQDRERQTSDPVSCLRSTKIRNPWMDISWSEKDKLRKNETCFGSCIEERDVREAIRRYFQPKVLMDKWCPPTKLIPL